MLARLLRDIRAGETLVVVQFDRLGRPVSHMLVVIEQLKTVGAHFRSLRDPSDTSQGMFSSQVLVLAVGQLPNAIRKLRAGHDAAHMEGVLAGLDTWLPTARRIRPDQPCGASCRS